MVFPVSSVMLARIETCRDTLRAHSGPLMSCIECRPKPETNFQVENETADLYLYFDLTENAAFLYGCVEHMKPCGASWTRRRSRR
jgi:hypothetical protein